MSYWHGTRACVLGGCGMIGHQLVRLLLEANSSVCVIDDISRGQQYLQGAAYIHSDVGDTASLTSAFYRYNPTHVFNLAAYVAGVEYNMGHQFMMFDLNVRLLLPPIRACLAMSIRPRFLQTSSVCVYGDDANDPAVEHTMGGYPASANRGYSYAKRTGEMAAAIAASSGMHTVVVRPTNCYGPADYFDDRAHVIPALIRKALSDEPFLRVNSSSDVKREFIYSRDVAEGMMAAMQLGQSGEVYNLGNPAGRVSMATLVDMILDACGVSKPYEFSVTEPGIDRSRTTDSSWANRKLLWTPNTSLEIGLRNTVEWYRRNT